MKEPPNSLPDLSKEAVHAAKNAAQAVEMARQEQLDVAIKFNDARTIQLLQQALREVFGPSNKYDTDQMHVLLPKIPLLCLRVDNIDANIEDIKSNLSWGVKLVLGAVIMSLLTLIFIK